MNAFELWETRSGNLMASYPTEGEALAAVSARIAKHGASSVDSVALVAVNDSDDDGDFEQIAEGPELVTLITTVQRAARLATQVAISPKDVEAAQRAIDEIKALPTRHIADVIDTSGIGSALVDLRRGVLKDFDFSALHAFDSVIAKGVDIGAFKTIETAAARHVLDSVGIAKLAGPFWANEEFLARLRVLNTVDAVQLAEMGTLQQRILNLGSEIAMPSIKQSMVTWTETVLQGLKEESLSPLARTMSDIAAWHQSLGASERQAVVSAARSLIDQEARELLDMSGDEFVTRLESGDLPEPVDDVDKAKLAALSIVAPLVRLDVAA